MQIITIRFISIRNYLKFTYEFFLQFDNHRMVIIIIY
jgi:hypothetical protein